MGLSTNFYSILGGKTRRLPDEDCYSHQVKLLPAGVEHVSVTKSGFVYKFLFNILGGKNRRLPDEDCYNHQVKLLPAGPLNISVSPKVVLSTNFSSILWGKTRRLPDEDCYSHWFKLLYQLGVENCSVTKSGFVNKFLFNTWGKKTDAFLMKTATAIR